MDRDLEEIVEAKVNLYELLEIIPYDDTTNEKLEVSAALIKRQYRQMALAYHPDKQAVGSSGLELAEKARKFHHISLAMKILLDPDLRSQYDTFYNRTFRTFVLSAAERERFSAHQQDLKEELRRTEANYQSFERELHAKLALTRRVEELREEGQQKRRSLEQAALAEARAPSPDRPSLEAPTTPPSATQPRPLSRQGDPHDFLAVAAEATHSRAVRVMWKRREELRLLLTPEVIEEMFRVFGTVERCTFGKPKGKYDTALIVFATPQAAHTATTYDFVKGNRGTESVWYNTSFKKLSSLLRGCEYAPPSRVMVPGEPTDPPHTNHLSPTFFTPFFNHAKVIERLADRGNERAMASGQTSPSPQTFEALLSQTLARLCASHTE